MFVNMAGLYIRMKMMEEVAMTQVAWVLSYVQRGIAVAWCYRQIVNVLSDYPRWMFKKNLIEFFLGLDYYLYYFTVAVLLLVHSHMIFQNVLWSLDLVM